MHEEQLKTLIDTHFEKLIAAGIRGVYPFAFSGAPTPRQHYQVDSAVVNNQLVFSPSTQILSFLIMDLACLIATAENVFPKKPRNDGLKMIVSAHNEILNSASSKLGLLLARIEGRNEVVVTPPMVTNHSGEGSLHLNAGECLFWTFRSEKITFDFVVTIQTI